MILLFFDFSKLVCHCYPVFQNRKRFNKAPISSSQLAFTWLAKPASINRYFSYHFSSRQFLHDWKEKNRERTFQRAFCLDISPNFRNFGNKDALMTLLYSVHEIVSLKALRLILCIRNLCKNPQFFFYLNNIYVSAFSVRAQTAHRERWCSVHIYVYFNFFIIEMNDLGPFFISNWEMHEPHSHSVSVRSSLVG